MYEERKYTVCDWFGNILEEFDNERERSQWLKRFCKHDGVNWLIFDLSRFPHKVSSRVVYLGEKW